MFTESTLRKLLDFSANDPVVSVYLNPEPSQGNADAHRARLRSLLKEVNRKQDEEVIETFFNHSYDWSGRGVAVFSCASAGFFQHFSLSLPVEDRLVIGEQPEIKPLLSLIDNYGGYGVVLVDKQNARIFLFQQGELVEQQAISGETVKHIKTGGRILGQRDGTVESSRTQDEVVDRNVRDLADLVTKYFEKKHVRRLLIGGSDENIALFKRQLSKAWQSLVLGTFPISIDAGSAEVLEKSLEVNRRVEMEHEKALVENLVTSAAKESAAVVGLEDTLEAVSNGRVQTLVFAEGASAHGYWHRDCGLLTTLAIKKHHACPDPAVRVDDVVSLAATAILKSGGSVEVLHPGTELDDHERMGALLRY
jgi:peptide subunit release factor 1 (eRF1)